MARISFRWCVPVKLQITSRSSSMNGWPICLMWGVFVVMDLRHALLSLSIPSSAVDHTEKWWRTMKEDIREFLAITVHAAGKKGLLLTSAFPIY